MSVGLRAGYKQTEVGVIPEDWEVRYLADVSRKITDGDHVTPVRASHGYYLLSARNVLNGRIDVSDVDYVGSAEYQRMKQRCSPEAGDILISCSGTIGRVAVVPFGFECVLVRSAALAKIDHDLANSRFLQFWLQGSKAQSQIATSVNQGAQPNLFLNHIERLVCPHPSLLEQRVIATALSDVDALLDGLDRLIAKKRDLKQAAMQQLLNGETRLPGFSGPWEVKRLGDLAEMGSGGTPLSSTSAYYDGKIPWVAISDMTKGGKFIESTERSLTMLGLTNSAAQMFPAGTVLYAMYASLGECSIAGVSLCTSQAILGIRPAMNLNADFLYYYLTSLRSAVKALGQQGTQSNLNKRMVQDFRFSVPSVAEQTAIAAILSDMDTELAALQARRTKTHALKQAMMQELLTGRIRLV